MLAPMRHASGQRTSIVTDAGPAPYWWRGYPRIGVVRGRAVAHAWGPVA
jgi:hypothetical protein